MIIDDQVAIVTGGHSGMGFAAAKALRSRGCRVALLGRRRELLEEKAASIGALPIVCDVSDSAAVEQALDQAAAAHGVARILVHAAAVGHMQMLLTPDGSPGDLESIRSVIATNLLGTIFVNRGFAARLVPTQVDDGGVRGVIVNVSSIGAADGVVGVAYAASKGGVDAAGLALARELGPWRIRVVTIAPGSIDTEMFRGGATPQAYDAVRSMVPGVWRIGRPEEFAALTLHVIDNDYLNGCNIRLDGGMRVPFSFDFGGGQSRPRQTGQ